jgi:hypothetical protein
MTGLDFAENIIDRNLGHQTGGVTKMLGYGALREGSQRSKESDAERLFKRQTGRHHFAEKPGHTLARQRPRVALLDPLQDLRLTLGTVNEARLAMTRLDLAHLLSIPRTLVQQLKQLPVELVDLLANDRQFVLKIVTHHSLPA